MSRSHAIERKIKIEYYLAAVSNSLIIFTRHADFRINQKQRNIFKDTVIRNLILDETPLLVGI